MSKPRKPIADLIEELRSWLPNYDHGPESFPNTFYRILASLPGGEELEDMGYEPMPGIGWHEADQLGRVLVEIQDKHDVEDLVAGLVHDEEEEQEVDESSLSEEAKKRRAAKRGGGESLAPQRLPNGVVIKWSKVPPGDNGYGGYYGKDDQGASYHLNQARDSGPKKFVLYYFRPRAPNNEGPAPMGYYPSLAAAKKAIAAGV